MRFIYFIRCFSVLFSPKFLSVGEVWVLFLARGLGFKVKGRVDQQDCNEQWVQKGDASRGLTEQRQVRGGQEWCLRHRSVDQEASRGQQCKAGWEGCNEWVIHERRRWNEHELIEEQRRCSEGFEGKHCWKRQGCASRSLSPFDEWSQMFLLRKREAAEGGGDKSHGHMRQLWQHIQGGKHGLLHESCGQQSWRR